MLRVFWDRQEETGKKFICSLFTPIMAGDELMSDWNLRAFELYLSNDLIKG